jgi:hypothetical protein
MSLRVERGPIDPEEPRFQYYISFKPMKEDGDVQLRVPVQVAVSISETGDLADVSFVLPKKFRNDQALSFMKREEQVNVVEPRVFIAIPGLSGDAILTASASLEVDAVGRIIGMDIQ